MSGGFFSDQVEILCAMIKLPGCPGVLAAVTLLDAVPRDHPPGTRAGCAVTAGSGRDARG